MKEKILNELAGLKGCFVAGGAVTSLFTNRPINDLDIYPKSQEPLEAAIEWAFDGNGLWCADASTRAISFVRNGEDKVAVQIMHFDVFETAEEIFEAFDFTCCMGAFDLDTESFVLHDKFLLHCSQRFLSFNKGTRFPYASAWRVRKYEEKGFTIGKIEFQKILMSCAEMPINSWQDLKDQVGGVYGEAISIPEDEEFSKDGMWKAIETLKFIKDAKGYTSSSEAIACISNRQIETLKYKEKIFAKIREDEGFIEIGREPKNPRHVTVNDIFKEKPFYKMVIVEDGYYTGPHQTKFKYIMNEIAVAEGPGLYVYPTIQEARGHYFSDYRKKLAIIELMPTEESDIVLGSDYDPFRGMTLKKAKVVAEHSIKGEAVASVDDQPF